MSDYIYTDAERKYQCAIAESHYLRMHLEDLSLSKEHRAYLENQLRRCERTIAAERERRYGATREYYRWVA